jgi:hypothetical protein
VRNLAFVTHEVPVQYLIYVDDRNATLRSKAESKARTILGAYGRIVLEQNGLTSIDVFERAVDIYSTSQGLEQLERVPEEFFQRRPSALLQNALSGSPCKAKLNRKRTTAKLNGCRKRSRCDSESDSLTEEHEEEVSYAPEDDFDEFGQPRYGSRPSSRGTNSHLSLRRSNSLPPLAPSSSTLRLSSNTSVACLTSQEVCPKLEMPLPQSRSPWDHVPPRQICTLASMPLAAHLSLACQLLCMRQ